MTESSPPVVAAFDLDGTLTEGGSVVRWLRFLVGSRATYRAALALAGPLAMGALRSGSTADRAKERLFRALLAGLDAEEVRDRSRDFALAHLEGRTRTHVARRLAWHLSRGHHVVIVSASPEMYVAIIAETFGAQGAVGTRLAVDELGQLTGGYLGHNCRGAEKLRRLEEWILRQGLGPDPVIYAYGNSRGDRRLLGAATHPFDVGGLGPVGALRKFPRLGRGDAD